MRRWSELYEIEAEYREFEPRLPRIDLVLGVALTLVLGFGGLFGFGRAGQKPLEADEPVVAGAEWDQPEMLEPVSDFDVTGRASVALCSVEAPERIPAWAEVHLARALESIECLEDMDVEIRVIEWNMERTVGVPTL
ncbi:MAG: hypothetical protein ACF8GE_01480 [Phycisphaerales bacterium JB043]